MNQKRITEIDALRGIAALFVVLYHYTFHYGRRFGHLSSDYNTEIFSYGHYGVQLFFIISGFVIFMSVRRGRSAGDFLIKRVFRLYPAYIASIVITFIVLNSSAIDIQRTIPEMILNMTMFQEFFGIRNIDGSYWSLRVELTFYLVMGVVMLLDKTKVMHVVVLMLIVGMIVQVQSLIAPNDMIQWVERFSTANYIQMFVIGIMLHEIWSNGLHRKYIGVIALSVLYDFIFEGVTNGLFTLTFIGIFALILRGKMKFLNNKVLLYLGSISYPLYLIHQNIGYALIHVMEDYGLTHEIWIIVPTFVSILLAHSILYVVEKPSQNFLFKHYKVIRDSINKSVSSIR